MARPKKTLRSVPMNISLPEDLAAKVELHLFSELEGKVPFGAKQEFFAKLVRGFFEQQSGESGE